MNYSIITTAFNFYETKVMCILNYNHVVLGLNAATYPYITEQLERLFSKKGDPQTSLPSELSHIVSLISISFWWENLQCYPDSHFIQLLVQGLEKSFHIGVNKETWLKSTKGNLISANDYPKMVST